MDDLRDIENLFNEEFNFNKTFEYKDEYWNDALVVLKKAEKAVLIKKFLFGGGAILTLIVGAFFLVNSFDSYKLDHEVALNPLSDSELLAENNLSNSNDTQNNQLANNLLGNLKDNELTTNEKTNEIEGDENIVEHSNISSDGNTNNRVDYSTSEEETYVNNNGSSNQLTDRDYSKSKDRDYKNSTDRDYTKSKDRDYKNSTDRDYSKSKDRDYSKSKDRDYAKSSDRDYGKDEKNKSNGNAISALVDDVMNNSDANKQSSENQSSESQGADQNSTTNNSNQSNSSSSSAANQAIASRDIATLYLFNNELLDEMIETDIVDEKLEQKAMPVISLEENNRLAVVLNVGAVMNGGLNNNQVYFDLPYLGGEVYYQISNRLNVAIGAGWYTRSGINYIVQNNGTTYGFGKKEITSFISLDKVYFAEIPLKFNYQIKPNHLIGLGGSYSIVLGGSNRSWNNQLDYGPNGLNKLENQDLQNLNGFDNTYKNPISVFASYEFRYNRFGIEGRYYYGLNDFTVDDVVGKNQFDRNSRFLLTLKYLLIK